MVKMNITPALARRKSFFPFFFRAAKWSGRRCASAPLAALEKIFNRPDLELIFSEPFVQQAD
jgi:hypothetical protein